MEIKSVLVTSNKGSIHRHQGLFKEMSSFFENVECLPCGDLHQIKILDILIRAYFKFINLFYPLTPSKLCKQKWTFIRRSRQAELKIRKLKFTLDIIFHFFCMFNPFWDTFDIPYVIYTDYTMALSKKNWSPWAPFNDEKEFISWIECERLAYERSHHIFTMGSIVKTSLIEDYGLKPEKITVVGSVGNFENSYEGEKSFGSQQILFNGSDFERKGGNLVLAAFKQVKKAIPEAKLVIIGKKLDISEDGVHNPGHISSALEMRNLFLKTDLVVAPAYCEFYGLFLVEAMNYGVPCIISTSGGMPDIVADGVNGVVIKQPTPDVLANQITKLVCDIPLLTSMSENARHKVKNKLHWNDIAKNISMI